MHVLKASNTMQQTHAVFGELAHYGSEPFNYVSAKTSWMLQPQSGYPG